MSPRLFLAALFAILCAQLAYGENRRITTLEAKSTKVFARIVAIAGVHREVRNVLDSRKKQRLMHTSRYKQGHDDCQVPLLRAVPLGRSSLR
jgi:hypothetical protein